MGFVGTAAYATRFAESIRRHPDVAAATKGPQYLAYSGQVTFQSFCGASRIRAPFAPPRLSESRKVEAEAQAVEISFETVSPEARIFFLRRRCTPSVFPSC